MLKPVVIEIGPQSVRVAQVIDRRGIARVIRFAEQPLPAGFRWDLGGDRAPVVHALRQAMTAAAIHARSAIISLTRGQVTARLAAFPPSEGEELRRVVEYDLTDHIPFPLDEVVVDYQKLGASRTEPGLVDVLVVATPRELIHEHVRLAQELGLRVHTITVDALALDDLVRLLGREPAGASIALDIGARSTTINLSFEGALRLTRSVGLGSNQLLRAIQDDLSLSAEAARVRVESGLPEALANAPPGGAIRSWLDGLLGEIRRSALSFGPMRITRLLVIGAEANNPALAQALAEGLGAESVCVTAAGMFPQAEFWGSDPPTANRCLLAIAAGLQALGKSAWSVSLLPAELQQQRRITRLRRLAAVAALAVVVLLAGWYLSLSQHVTAVRADMVELKTEVAAAGKRQAQLATALADRDTLRARADALRIVPVRRYAALELLRSAALYAPQEIVLSSLTMRPEQPVEVRGTAPDSTAVAAFQQALDGIPIVTKANLSSIDRTVSRQQSAGRLNFTMQLTLWIEQEAAPSTVALRPEESTR